MCWVVARQWFIFATFSTYITAWDEGVSFMKILDREHHESWSKDIFKYSIYRSSSIMVWDNKGSINCILVICIL